MKTLSQKKSELARPLTYSEKILYSHSTAPAFFREKRRIFITYAGSNCYAGMQQLRWLYCNLCSPAKSKSQKPCTVHCDHLIRAEQGEESDMKQAVQEHGEVFDFLSSASSHYGIGFWGPGSGIIHQVVLENYAYPGGLMIGTDSHTPNAGGLGMMAVGVGGADAADVMSGLEWEIRFPKIVGVHLTGRLQGWASPKDVILKLLKILTVKGGTNRIIEYFGEGCSSISCTGKSDHYQYGSRTWSHDFSFSL